MHMDRKRLATMRSMTGLESHIYRSVGGLVLFYPILATFFWWLGVTRKSEPPVACGHRLSCCLIFSMLLRKEMVSYAATTKKTPKYAFISEGQSHSREYDMV